MADLFSNSEPAAPASTGATAPGTRPLADRLRPASLAEVIGQDHLLGQMILPNYFRQ